MIFNRQWCAFRNAVSEDATSAYTTDHAADADAVADVTNAITNDATSA